MTNISTINPPNLNTVDSLLNENMQSNHFRLLMAPLIIGILGYGITTWLEWRGLATEAITYAVLLRTGLTAILILFLTWWVVKVYGSKPWAKWLVVTSVLATMIVFRMAPTDAPESHAIFYLAIVLSLFYFDRLLIIYCTSLCMLGDMVLMHFYPLLIPEGTFVSSILMRYFFYVSFAIAASIGSSTIRDLLNAASTIKGDNIRLQEENRLKTKIDRGRKEFIAAVSHELKSPLSLIEGYAEGLKDGIVSGKESEMFADIIIEEVHTMEKLVSEMLEVSKLESKYYKPKIVQFPLKNMLEQVLKEYHMTFDGINITLQQFMPDQDLIVTGDPFMIERVINNFVDNALRHTVLGGKITLGAKVMQTKVIVEVKNEGSPINEHDLPRIWEPFYRAEKSRSREYGGTGLGLSIASTILNLHNSEYGVHNEAHGVCFYFTLPIAIE